MGGGTSKIPYNPENPRRLRDVIKGDEFIELFPGVEEKVLVEQLLDFTAPEYFAFMMRLAMQGMAFSMYDSEGMNASLTKNWKPYINVVNYCTDPITAVMWAEIWPERIQKLESETITIQPLETGRLPLPTQVNFNRDYPLNPILNQRTIWFGFPDGASIKYNCGGLNYGRSKGDLLVNADRTFQGIEEARDSVPDARPKEESDAIVDFVAEGSSCGVHLTDERREVIEQLVTTLLPIMKKN
jgi:hypothetical protein